jgi:hypothetical protein
MSPTSQKNLTAFILLNNLVSSPNVYRISEAEEIESWVSGNATGMMVWSVNHTTSVTIDGTSMYVDPNFNCGTLRTYASEFQWPVFAIYNWTNIPYPVTVYIGSTSYDPSNYGIANTTGTLQVQNYFVAGYVSDGESFIIYSSAVNATNVNVMVNNVPPCSGNSG